MSKRGQSNLEAACSVFWGEFSSVDDHHLHTQADSPEEVAITKDLLSKLSEESKLMIAAIFRLPDEMFTHGGRVVVSELKSFMRRRYNWKPEVVDHCRKEVATALGYTL